MDLQSQPYAHPLGSEGSAGAASARGRPQSLILQMPAPLALTDGPEHHFVLVNDAYKRVDGGSREVIGLTPRHRGSMTSARE